MDHDDCTGAACRALVCSPSSRDKIPALPPDLKVAENIATEHSNAPSDEKVINLVDRVGRQWRHK